MLIVMLACAGAYTWWQRPRHPAIARSNRSVVKQATAAPNPPPSQSASATPDNTAGITEVPGTILEEKGESAKSAAAEQKQTVAGGQPPGATEDPNAAVRVEVVAQEAAWISARADGQYSFSGVLEPNQTRTVEANQNVLLKVGNAGGVEVRLNGKSIGSLGAKGAVRSIQFTSGGFQIVPPDAPKPSTESSSPL
jgi:hypothetical protein